MEGKVDAAGWSTWQHLEVVLSTREVWGAGVGSMTRAADCERRAAGLGARLAAADSGGRPAAQAAPAVTPVTAVVSPTRPAPNTQHQVRYHTLSQGVHNTLFVA